MSNLTNQEITLLRTQPHSSKLWLSVYQPETRLACRVNDVAIAKGERSITYDGVTAGGYLVVEAGMTLRVGSSLGASDKGTVRVRSITSSVITVAENDHIDWSDNDYLTVVAFFEINAVYPRIIQDPANDLNVIFYKDYDVAYTNQNSVLGSFVCMGGHYAGFLEGGQAPVYYSASGTSNVKGDSLTYAWFFEGGDVTGSSSQNPGYINYSSPGHYTTRLIVTNASGGTDTSYRHISIYDRPENGSNNPILSWSLEALSGAREAGGSKARIRVYSDIGDPVLSEGSLVVIFSDNRYGNTEQSIGGNAENRQSIFFVGYVLDGSIQFDYANGFYEFEVGSPGEVMKVAEGFSISVRDSTDPAGQASSDNDIPSGWVLVLNMNVKRAIYHYLRWHTTCLMCMDVRFNGTDQLLQYFDADRESIYDAIDKLMKTALVGSAVFDRQGTLYLEVDGYTSGLTLSNTFTLDKQDWMGEPEIIDVPVNQVSFIEAGGIKWDGAAANTFNALLASAPGESPAYRGKISRFQGLALTSQAQLNQLVGDIFAWENSRFPANRFSLAGNFSNFDIAPQESIKINLAPGDTRKRISFFGKEFLVAGVDFIYDSRYEILTPVVSFSEITSGVAASTITIPDVPPTEGDPNTGGGSFDVPPFNIPPLPLPLPNTGGGSSNQEYGFVLHRAFSNDPLDNTDADGYLEITHIFQDSDNMFVQNTSPISLDSNSIYCVDLYGSFYNKDAAGAQTISFYALLYQFNGETVVNSWSIQHRLTNLANGEGIRDSRSVIVDTADGTTLKLIWSAVYPANGYLRDFYVTIVKISGSII